MQNRDTESGENAEKAESRKKDHIDLAFRSRQTGETIDKRFWYEPMLSGHPEMPGNITPFEFAGRELVVPIWVSSMTGGTEMAETINRNLCRACREFGMGFGLGSCRSLLEGNLKRLKDFDFRDTIGENQPFYANLGIAQLQVFAKNKSWTKVEELIGMLQADGLIIHVNPMQEAMQPEGDHFEISPLEIIRSALEHTGLRIIVKEVGQGFGPGSMRELLQLPLQAVEFGAHGGTNFSKLELLRSDDIKMNAFAPLSNVGHTAEEMVEISNRLKTELGEACKVGDLIISGGVRDFLDGYYFTEKSDFNAVYGQASGFLKYATGDYKLLRDHVNSQLRGFYLAKAFLRIK
jgi:isopentenyl-diphosphate Delta-isomerase